MKNEDLEQRAVTALGSDNVSLNELADLTREAETALATAYTAVEEARREGVDPVLSPDPVAARERVGAAEFSYARATALLSRLNERCRQVAAAERNAIWEADYGRVKDERDRLAVELAATYPQTVATLLDLLARVADCERECSRIASMAPAGERRRLLGPELHAKGLTGFTRDMPSITRDLRLPDWKQPSRTAWPPERAREVATCEYPYSDRYSANWWRAGTRNSS
jgi:hypothetical protein